MSLCQRVALVLFKFQLTSLDKVLEMKVSTKQWVKFEGQAGGFKFCRRWKIFSILLLVKKPQQLTHVT